MRKILAVYLQTKNDCGLDLVELQTGETESSVCASRIRLAAPWHDRPTDTETIESFVADPYCELYAQTMELEQ